MIWHPLKQTLISISHFNVSDEEIREAEKDLEEALKKPPGKIYLNDLESNFQGIINVPFDLQVEACAIVAGVTFEEMISKLNKASGF